MAVGTDAEHVAGQLSSALSGEGLVVAFVFADWRIDAAVLAGAMQRTLPIPVVGCTTVGVLSTEPAATATAIGLYGDWLRVGIGVAAELPKSPLVRSRDAVHQAAAALGTDVERLDPTRHVAVTLVDGSCGVEEAFCIGSAVSAPQIRFIGGSAATEVPSNRRCFVLVNGEALADAAVVVLLETQLPFDVVTSSHLVSTDVRTVVTAANGRAIDELDGRPAADRFRELVAQLGTKLDESRPSEYAFARFVDGMPYVRSMTHIEGTRIHLASAVETGHVLRVMRPGDLIGVTRGALAASALRVGGKMGALLAFSCISRHWHAAARGIESELAKIYAEYPTAGFQTQGEQTGMLLVNHTLTALAIGAPEEHR
ncbi:MAG: hypothetical protein JWO36_5706 [Myxococcales bacterium]|nr:hypothetical protein [Myxococcales bacterium]